MKAYLDLSKRKAEGENIDSKDINKHKNDVFRLYQLLIPENKILLPSAILNDMRQFISIISQEEIDLNSIGLNRLSKNRNIRDTKTYLWIVIGKRVTV